MASMTPKSSHFFTIALLLVLSLILTGCNHSDERPENMASDPAQPLDNSALLDAASPINAESSLKPLPQDQCQSLAHDVAQALMTPGETTQVAFVDPLSLESGEGCQSRFVNSGVMFASMSEVAIPIVTTLIYDSWEEDPLYASAGPGGMSYGFRRSDQLCLLVIARAPSLENLCSPDEPFINCWDQLSPEQKIFAASLNCVQGTETESVTITELAPGLDIEHEPDRAVLPEGEAIRIEFNSGTTSASMDGTLDLSETDRYILYASGGQKMSVEVWPHSGDAAEIGPILTIAGMDGIPLLTDHAGSSTFFGELPTTQDYIISVHTLPDVAVDYSIEVTIPPSIVQPPDSSITFAILPLDIPSGFEFLIGLQLPIILPPDFPVDDALAEIHPLVLTSEPDEYEISLDYGPDCRGAGACHYGSLAGKTIESESPESTSSFVYDEQRAVPVMLFGGIQGYFLEGLCGANCDDSRMFWQINHVQYVVGLKGGSQKDLHQLANMMIDNSVSR
jgi:hypothetical protein